MLRLKRSLCLEMQPVWACFQVFWERDTPIFELRFERGELRQAQARWRHGSAHSSRSAVGLLSRRHGASKCSEILVHRPFLFFWFCLLHPHS